MCVLLFCGLIIGAREISGQKDSLYCVFQGNDGLVCPTFKKSGSKSKLTVGLNAIGGYIIKFQDSNPC